MRKQATPENRTILKLPLGAPTVRLSTQEHSSVEAMAPIMLIGARRDCDLVLPNCEVSQLHCAIVNTGGAVLAVDLGTRSGTFINDQRISVGRLYDDCELRIASERISVRLAPDAGKSGAAERLSFGSPMLSMVSADQQIVVPQLPAVIGRRHTCQIVVDTPDVSLAHALLFIIDGRLAIHDLGSRSGVYLNGERTSSAWIEHGDDLGIGGVQFKLSKHVGVAESILANSVNESLVAMTDMALAEVMDAEAAAARTREAELAAKEERLAAKERDLIRRETELAKREAAAVESSAQLAQFMEALSEAHHVVGFGDPQAESRSAEGLSDRPDLTSLSKSESEKSLADSNLPAPPVMTQMFPHVGGSH